MLVSGKGQLAASKHGVFRDHLPQQPLPHKCRDAPVEGDSRHALHVCNAFGCEVSFLIEMGRVCGKCTVVFILDTLDGKQVGPLKIAIRPDEGDDQCDRQRNERRRDVPVQARERLAKGLDRCCAVKGICRTNPDRKTTGRANYWRGDGGRSGLALPYQGKSSGEATGA